MKILKAVSIFICISFLSIGCGSNGSESDNTMGNVEGTVSDSSTGELLSGVTVSIGDISDTTGSNGIYTINNLYSGSPTVSAALSGYHPYLGTCTVVSDATTFHNIHMNAVAVNNTDPDTDNCAIDFSRNTSNFAVLIAANANFPSIAGNNLTVEAWVKPTAPASSAAQGIFGRYGSAGALLYVQGGKAKFALRQSSPSPPAAATITDYTVSGTTIMTTNTWYHIAGVVVNEAHTHAVTASCTTTVMAETPHLDILVDGTFENCAATWDANSFTEPQGVTNPESFGGSSAVNIAHIGSLPGPPIAPHVGGNTDSSIRKFQGAIDEVRLWTLARSAADIMTCKDAELTSSGACVLNPNILKGYWKMNVCEGYNVYDWSGSGSTGRIEIGITPWIHGWVYGAF